ncbi:MAG: ThuA domain-containing protein [Dysgonamonadaceae bacterium]|jgi:type 1 glutamine amidotransferase|nr:ThuA domain-containing protein [Dysgonamonadaceae bacterium]
MTTKKITIALIAAIFCMTNVMAISPDALKGKKVLYVYGGWYGHEPEQCRDIFVPWLESEGAIVTVSNTLSIYDDEELMANVDLIIQHYTMGEISDSQSKALVGAVKRGVGLAGWHGGTGDSFRDNVEFQYMVGGQWVAHPGNSIDYMVNITDRNNPVTFGLNDFKMTRTEQYFMHIDPNVKVLATTTFSGEHDWWIEGSVIPVVWQKMFGHGRVFYSSLGHVARDFEVYEAFEIMKRGIRWAAESLEKKGQTQWLSPVYR